MREHLKDKRVSKCTREILKTVNYKVNNRPVAHKYYRNDVIVTLDFNLLENQYIVRKFYQHKYNIKLEVLELLLFLYPKAYFSRKDYNSFPANFSHRIIGTMIKKGFIKRFVEGPTWDKDVYTLSKSSHLLVKNYYRYLTGEKVVPYNNKIKPMFGEDTTRHDRKIISLFKKLAIKNKKENLQENK